MTTAPKRFLTRTLRDLTAVSGEDLRGERSTPYLVTQPKASAPTSLASCQVICIASGKGGTGKTVMSTNLAVSLVQEGLKVALLDADLGLANAHMLLGVSPMYDISHIVAGERDMEEVMVECPSGVRLVSGGSGFSELAELSDRQLRHLASELAFCENQSDVMIVDLSAGISPQIMRFLRYAHDILLVTNPDVTALLDAYATIKCLAQEREQVSLKLIVNRARSKDDALIAFQKIKTVVAKHLPNVELSLFQWFPQNWYVQNAVAMREPVVMLHPKSFVTRSFRAMAGQLKVKHEAWRKRVETARTKGEESLAHDLVPFSRMLEQVIYD